MRGLLSSLSPKLAAVDFLGWGMGRPGRGVIGSEHRGGGGGPDPAVSGARWICPEGWAALVTTTTRRRPPKQTAWPRSPPLQLLLPLPRKTKTMTMMSPRPAATRKRSELVGGESLTFSSLLDSGMPEAVLLVNMVPWGKKYSCCSHPALTRLGSIFLGHFL